MKTLIATFIGATAAVTVLAASPVNAQDGTAIPHIAQALLDAAYESGNPVEISAVVKAVRTVFPDYEAAINEQAEVKITELSRTITTTAAPQPEVDNEANIGEANTGETNTGETDIGETDIGETDIGEPSKAGVFALSPWDGKVEASALFSSGNSENSAVGILIDASRTSGDFVHNFDAFFNLGSSNGVTNQKRWGAAYKLDYSFGEHTYAYGRIAYVEDEFSGFDYRLFAGAGLGHFLAKSERFTWKVEGGPGYRYSPIDASRVIEQNFAVYASSELDWLIRDGLTFEQDWNVTWTSPTTSFQSVTALTTQLWESLSTGISFEYRYETNPPLGRDKTDTLAKVSVIYGF